VLKLVRNQLPAAPKMGKNLLQMDETGWKMTPKYKIIITFGNLTPNDFSEG